jgi:hypothetical protein
MFGVEALALRSSLGSEIWTRHHDVYTIRRIPPSNKALDEWAAAQPKTNHPFLDWEPGCLILDYDRLEGLAPLAPPWRLLGVGDPVRAKRAARPIRHLSPALMCSVGVGATLFLFAAGLFGWRLMALQHTAHLPALSPGWRSAALAGLAGGAIAALASFGISNAFSQWAPSLVAQPTHESVVVLRGHAGWIAVWLLSLCILTPIAEETFFRGFLFGPFAVARRPWLGAVITASLFGAAHWGQGIDGVLGAAFFGLLAAWLYVRNRTLVAPIVAHIVMNVAAAYALMH